MVIEGKRRGMEEKEWEGKANNGSYL